MKNRHSSKRDLARTDCRALAKREGPKLKLGHRDWCLARGGKSLTQIMILLAFELPSVIHREMKQPSPTEPRYGLGIWLAHNPSQAEEKQQTFLDEGIFWLDGHAARRVYIAPASSVVVVRVGENCRAWDEGALPHAVLRAIETGTHRVLTSPRGFGIGRYYAKNSESRTWWTCLSRIEPIGRRDADVPQGCRLRGVPARHG
jgi:hypothetical protein